MYARHTSRRRAIALLPAALLCTVAFARVGGDGAPTADPVSASRPGPSVPNGAVEAPASVSQPGLVVAGGKDRYGGPRVSATATTSDIPAAALSAYQRAETVINSADPSCHISWHLIAAVGRVETDHGRAHGNALDDQGLAIPGIFGIALDGRNLTAVVRDTDAGQYDGDTTWDRAVGPMQFIPSTWSLVGVDGDSDGERNPQDIDDAALATAVYLCSGTGDLATDADRRAALFRYNPSHDYVDVVLSVMEAYLTSDFASGYSTISYGGSLGIAPEIAHTKHVQGSSGDAGGRDGSGPGGSAGNHGGAGAFTPVPGSEPTPGPGPEPTPGPDPTPEPDPEPEPEPDPPPAPDPDPEPDPEPPPPSTPTEEEAIEACLVVVGATDVTTLEQLGLLDDFTTCMTDLGFPDWLAP